MSLPLILDQIAIVAGTVVGVSKSLSRPPDAITDDKTAVAFPLDGTIDSTTQSGLEIRQHNIALRVFFTRQSPTTEQVIGNAIDLLEGMLAAFRAKVMLNGTCSDCSITGYRFGVIPYAGSPFIVLELTMLVTEKPSVTYAP